MWGGTHRFNDAAAVEAKHRVSLKAHGKKIRVRSDTQTEKDLLRVTQEELVYERLEEILHKEMADEEVAAHDDEPAPKASVHVNSALHTDKHVFDDQRQHLVHQEVLLSWGEVLKKFVHCFPAISPVQQQAKWGIYQHAVHEHDDGKRYHYWGTDTRYPAIARGGVRRRRDMVRVSDGKGGEHRAEIVCFVEARLPPPPGAQPADTIKKAPQVSTCVCYLTHIIWNNS